MAAFRRSHFIFCCRGEACSSRCRNPFRAKPSYTCAQFGRVAFVMRPQDRGICNGGITDATLPQPGEKSHPRPPCLSKKFSSPEWLRFGAAIRLSIKSQTGKSRESIFRETKKRRYFKNLLLYLGQCLQMLAAQGFCLSAQTPPYRTICTPTGGVYLTLGLSPSLSACRKILFRHADSPEKSGLYFV